MLKRFVHILVSVTLVFLLMLNGLAHEFVHSFTGHEDTIDQVHVDQSGHRHASIEKMHHHCDFLDLQSPAFIVSHLQFNFSVAFQHVDYYVLSPQYIHSLELRHTALRGPPSIV